MSRLLKMSKENTILLIFFLIALAYLVWMICASMRKSHKKDAMEHFTDVSEETGYESRMTVMKVFDNLLNRKPDLAEIEKYSEITNEQDMLIAVIAQYKIGVDEENTSAKVESYAEAEAVDAVEAVEAEPFVATTLDVKSIEKKIDAIIEEANSVRAMLLAQTL